VAGGRADAERLAITELSSALRAYVARMRQGQALVELRGGVAEAAAQRAVNEARRELAVAMERLEACRQQEDASCSWAAAAVDRAKRHLEAMYAVARDLADLWAQYRPIAGRFSTALETLGQQVQRELTRAGDTLDVYLGSTAGGRRTSGSSASGRLTGDPSAASALSQPPGFPADIVMVPLALIDSADIPVHGPADFQKGYSPADIEWAHEAFISVIMPGGAKGLTLDDFRARDQREGRTGTRSYADTYSGFFGNDAIKLDPKGQMFDAGNGHHRLWVARQMGLDSVPAKVSGHGASW